MSVTSLQWQTVDLGYGGCKDVLSSTNWLYLHLADFIAVIKLGGRERRERKGREEERRGGGEERRGSG